MNAEILELLHEYRRKTFGGSRGWVEMPTGLAVYVRFCTRYFHPVFGETLDLASLKTRPESARGKGLLKAWLTDVLEPFVDEHGMTIYVENVMEERFQRFWLARGYEDATVPGNPVPSYFRTPPGGMREVVVRV